MKQLVILLFSVVSISVNAQQISADFYANYWAGGVCCSQGTDMVLSISVDGNIQNYFDEVQLITENGSIYTLKETDFEHLNSGDTLQVYRVRFGYSSNGREEYTTEVEKIHFNGPESLREFRWYLGSEDNTNALKINVLRDRKTIPCEKLKIREDYTAYP